MTWVVWLKKLALPPSGPLLVALATLPWLDATWARALLAADLLLLWLLCLPAVGSWLLRRLERHPPLADDALDALSGADATALVVLDAGRAPGAREYGGDTANPATLERLRYAAHLARRTGLPVLASGDGAGALMGGVLREFGAEARWIEDASRNTHENAVRSASMLRPAGVRRVVLVSHFWHLPRAEAAFAAAGLDVVAAPMGLAGPDRWHRRAMALVPSVTALTSSRLALHELLGRLWYRLRYGHRRV